MIMDIMDNNVYIKESLLVYWNKFVQRIELLEETIRKNDIEAVKDLLFYYKVNPNLHDNDVCTALMSASSWGFTECVRLLLEAGANPNIQSRNGWTALRYATYLDNTEIVILLLRAGSKINLKDRNGSYKNKKIIKILKRITIVHFLNNTKNK